MRKTLAAIRDQLIASVVREEVRAYIDGARRRRCACCGSSFVPHMRYHFLCSDPCRRLWYRGVFRPRTGD